MNIAIFGGGSIGSRHARNARMLGHDVKIFDSNPLRGRNPEHFCALDHQAVIICTPASTHEDVARHLALSYYEGPLFVEKPIALRSEAEIFKAWPHPVQMVGYNWRFHPDLRPWTSCGRPLRFIRAVCHTRMSDWPGRDYADPLLECSHELDLLRLVLGSTPKVTGMRGLSGAFFQFDRGIVDIDWNEYPQRFFEFERNTRVYTSPAGLEQSYVNELRHFLESVELGFIHWPACTFADGLAVVSIIEEARRLADVVPSR